MPLHQSAFGNVISVSAQWVSVVKMRLKIKRSLHVMNNGHYPPGHARISFNRFVPRLVAPYFSAERLDVVNLLFADDSLIPSGLFQIAPALGNA